MPGFPLESVNYGLFGTGIGKLRLVGICGLRFVVDDYAATVGELDNEVELGMARQGDVNAVTISQLDMFSSTANIRAIFAVYMSRSL